MTDETRIELLLDQYNEKRKALNAVYDEKFENVSVNEAGEASAEEILEINMWYIETENEINNWFKKRIAEVCGK